VTEHQVPFARIDPSPSSDDLSLPPLPSGSKIVSRDYVKAQSCPFFLAIFNGFEEFDAHSKRALRSALRSPRLRQANLGKEKEM
jgi:hypothetical protein